MSNSSIAFACALAASVALSACGSGGGSGAPVAPGQVAAAFRSAGDAQTPNVSGEYAGTVKDSQNGKARMTASLAQYKRVIGGDLIVVAGTLSSSSSVAWTLSADGFAGTGAATVGSAACVYGFHGKYDAATHRLTGSYEAVNGCSGQTGTFAMRQKCYYARHGGTPEVGGLKMC